MKLSKTERIIINDLFKATEGLYIFTLYSRYKTPLKELFESINKLESEGIIDNKEDRVILTKKGIDFSIKKQLGGKKDNPTSDFLELSKGPKIDINVFYIPLNFE